MAATRRLTPLARQAITSQRVVETRPDWKGGLLLTLAAVLALGWLDAMDDAAYLAGEVGRARAAEAQWANRANAVETTAAVRLADGPQGYHCELFNIQREWELVVAAECKRMAGILRTARGTP